MNQEKSMQPPQSLWSSGIEAEAEFEVVAEHQDRAEAKGQGFSEATSTIDTTTNSTTRVHHRHSCIHNSGDNQRHNIHNQFHGHPNPDPHHLHSHANGKSLYGFRRSIATLTSTSTTSSSPSPSTMSSGNSSTRNKNKPSLVMLLLAVFPSDSMMNFLWCLPRTKKTNTAASPASLTSPGSPTNATSTLSTNTNTNNNNNNNNMTKIIRTTTTAGAKKLTHQQTVLVLLLLRIILLLTMLYLFGSIGLWFYNHIQCYSRELGITWTEGISHSVTTRTCPLPNDNKRGTGRGEYSYYYYPEEGDKNDHQYQGERQESTQPINIDPKRICITSLSDSSPYSSSTNPISHVSSSLSTSTSTLFMLYNFIEQQFQLFFTVSCRDFTSVQQYTWPFTLRYCKKHGYTCYEASHLLDRTRPPAWSKIRAVQYLLQSPSPLSPSTSTQQQHSSNSNSNSISQSKSNTNNNDNNNGNLQETSTNVGGRPVCDWVLWMDADTLIMNSTIKIETLLPPPVPLPQNDTSRTTDNSDAAPTATTSKSSGSSSNKNNTSYNEVHLIVTFDKVFIANSGVWLIRNTDWSHRFLQEWWDMKNYVRPKGYSLSGDNAAFGALIRRKQPASILPIFEHQKQEQKLLLQKQQQQQQQRERHLQQQIKHQYQQQHSKSRSNNLIGSGSSTPNDWDDWNVTQVAPLPVQITADGHIRLLPRCTMNSFGVFIPKNKIGKNNNSKKKKSLKGNAGSPKANNNEGLSSSSSSLQHHHEIEAEVDDGALDSALGTDWYLSEQFYHSGDFIAHASGIDQKEAGIKLLMQRAI